MVTLEQIQDIQFCEHWLNIEYDGDVLDDESVKEFLVSNLNDAMTVYYDNYYEEMESSLID